MPELLILLLIFILSLLLLRKNFDLGIKVLLVLSVFLHKEVFSIFKWDFLPVRFFMVAVGVYFGINVLKWLKNKDLKSKLTGILKEPFLFLLMSIWLVRGISIVFSKNLTASIFLYSFFTLVVILGLVIFEKYYLQKQKVLQLIKLYIYISLALTFFGFFQLYLYSTYEFIIGALWNVPGHVPRIGSTFWDVNHFAALLASLLPMLGVFILLEKKFKTKAWYSVMFVLMTGMLFLTSSRTAWIIAAVSFLSFVTILLVRKFGSRGIVYILATLILIAIPLLREYSIKSSPFRAYVKQNFHYRLDSFASHFMLLTGSYQIFEEYPILGGGYGSFFEHFRKTDISAEFFGRDPAALNTRVPAHTIWGEAMAETGVVGISLLLLFVMLILGVFLFGALKLKEKSEHLILNALFSTMLGVFLAGVFYSYNSEFFWLIIFLYFLLGTSLVFKQYSYRDIYKYYLRSWKFYFLFIVLISFALIFPGLGKTHLVPWDEAIYAQVAKNMVVRGEYLDMFWKPNLIWFEKPPLLMWNMSIFMKLLGFTSLAARIPSAVFGFLTVIVTFLLSKKLFGKVAAYFSSLALVTGVHFLYYTRSAMLDVTTTFFITLSIFLYVIAKEKNLLRFWFLAGLAAGLAVMSKGVIGLFPLVIIFVQELFIRIFGGDESTRPNFLSKFLMFVSGMVLISFPWHLLMYVRYGQEFLQNYFIYHVFSRAATAIEDKGQPLFWYITVMRVSMRLWFILLLGAFPLFIYKTLKKYEKFSLFTIWAVSVFVVFSVSSSKIIWYIIPLYPAVSIMVGYLAAHTVKFLEKRLPVMQKVLGQFLVIYVATAVVLMYLFFYRHLVYTNDLTKSQAELLRLKDETFSVEQLVYVDRVEMPLVMFYTEGPFKIIDFAPAHGRAPMQTYDNRIVLVTKKGRFTDDPSYYNRSPTVIKEMGDYILFYYESDLRLDKERLKVVRKLIKDYRAAPQGDSNINKLMEEEISLIKRISVFEEVS